MAPNPTIESALRIPRLITTVNAARNFGKEAITQTAFDGMAEYRMRSAMDLDPRIGKWISRRAIRVNDPHASRIADTSTSSFVDRAEVDSAVAGIQRDGFYVFERVVPADIVERIREFAEQVPTIARGAGTPPARYPRANPTVGRYDINEETALQSPDVQDFATDPLLALIAQRYLDQPVLMDEVAFWWTTNRRSEDANLNAQMFHQDRDRLAFLKFFIYLTDVTPETGPHVYLRGSHRAIPRALRKDGRIDDDAVRRAGLWHEVREICGPAGTLMAVDTIGLHKGKTPISGDRLALENEFATSLFGAQFDLPTFVPTEKTRERFAQMPWVLQRYRSAVAG